MPQRPTATAARTLRRAFAGLAFCLVVIAGGADTLEATSSWTEGLSQQGQTLIRWTFAWYDHTPPGARISWGGLAVCAAWGMGVIVERLIRLRRERIVPARFVDRFFGRLSQGKLDRLKSLDLCEMNASPAARVALAAVQRWGRPTADLERAASLAGRNEIDRLKRNLGTLKRIAVLAPLLGLLGTLASAAHVLSISGSVLTGSTSGPALADALGPLIAGVALAILALVAYDGLVVRVEALAIALNRLGAATIDAIEQATSTDPRLADRATRSDGPASGTIRTPHQVRHDVPEPSDSRSARD